MNLLYKIYRWILISIIVQIIILSYINFIYLNRKTQIVATSFDLPKLLINSKCKGQLPTGAADIKLSYNNSYVGYIIDNHLEIINISTQDKKTIKPQSGEITYYRWMADRDILVYALKDSKNNSPKAQIVTYDIVSGNEKTYPKIVIDSKNGGKVTQIELSALTNVVYVVVEDGDKEKIYRYDIMQYSSFIMNTHLGTVIKEANFSDTLLYQDKNKDIYVKDRTHYITKKLPLNSKAALLKIDNEDRVFVGLLDKNDAVEKILYGKLTEKPDGWGAIALKEPLNARNILVSNDGKVYTKQNKNSLLNLENNTAINFLGNFIELNYGNIVSKEEDRFYLTSIK